MLAFYTTPQIAKAARVPERKLITYEERGYVQPSVQRASGHGSRRLWSFLDAVRCRAITDMLTFLTVDAVRELGPFLRQDDKVARDVSWTITRDEDGAFKVMFYSIKDGTVTWLGADSELSQIVALDEYSELTFYLTLNLRSIHEQVELDLGEFASIG